MADQYLGQIILVPFNFAPEGWALCNGQLLSISQNTALFSLLGTQFGGNGTSNFALPDLQSRVPIGMGQGAGLSSYDMGEQAGAEAVTLLATQLPAHNHQIKVDSSSANSVQAPGNNYPAGAAVIENRVSYNALAYSPASSGAQLNAGAIAISGTGRPHNNIQPVLALNFIIALTGIYPPRS